VGLGFLHGGGGGTCRPPGAAAFISTARRRIGRPACCQAAAWLRGEDGDFAKNPLENLLGWVGGCLGLVGPFGGLRRVERRWREFGLSPKTEGLLFFFFFQIWFQNCIQTPLLFSNLFEVSNFLNFPNITWTS
jgi:hypothetical protein